MSGENLENVVLKVWDLRDLPVLQDCRDHLVHLVSDLRDGKASEEIQDDQVHPDPEEVPVHKDLKGSVSSATSLLLVLFMAVERRRDHENKGPHHISYKI